MTVGTVLLSDSPECDWPGHTLQMQASQVGSSGEQTERREKHPHKYLCTIPLPGM